MKTTLISWTILAFVAAMLVACGNQGGQSSGAASSVPPETPKAQAPTLTPTPTQDRAAEGTVPSAQEPATEKPAAPESTAPAASPAPEAAPEVTPLPDVLARVAGKDITKQQFEREYAVRTRQIEMRTRRRVPPSDEVSAMVLKNMIESQTLGVLAERAGIKITDEELQAEFQENKKQLPSEEEYLAYLKRENLTEPELLELIRGSMVTSRYIDSATASLQVSDEEMNQEYEKLKGAGVLERKTDTTDVAHILVKVAPGADEAAWQEGKQRIDQARARVVAGESFADVAKEVSQDPGSAQRGGAYKDVSPGKMAPEFEEKMLSTPVGQVSEAFKTSYGWHVLTVTGKHQAGPVAMDDVKEDLTQGVLSKKRREAVRKTLDDAKNAVNVEVFFLKDLVFPPKTSGEPAPGQPAAPGAEPATAPQKTTEQPASDAGNAAAQPASSSETKAPSQ